MHHPLSLKTDLNSLRLWFLSSKRDFPWRNTPTPYAVWVSEIMLQQTVASVVVPYFIRWMDKFPTIKALAEADIADVIKLWEGLGYYSRARNLYAGARYIVEHFEGELPSDAKALQSIKGIGPYTLGAILSFAFHQKAAAVDGNVIRVLARYYGIEEDISLAITRKKIEVIAQTMLPDFEPWVISEALIELGATICTPRKPQCFTCPLRTGCLAYQQSKVEKIPHKSAKIKYEPLYRSVVVIIHQDKVLLQKVGSGKIMSDLYEFPYFESDEAGHSIDHIVQLVSDKLQLNGSFHSLFKLVKHSFTRFRVQLRPIKLEVFEHATVKDHTWIPINKLITLPFSSGHRRIVAQILDDVSLTLTNP